jgi:hypothetical protein
MGRRRARDDIRPNVLFCQTKTGEELTTDLGADLVDYGLPAETAGCYKSRINRKCMSNAVIIHEKITALDVDVSHI